MSHHRPVKGTLARLADPPRSGLAGRRPQVRLVADLVCPWCYLAFHRLMLLAAEAPVDLRWHPFLLDPGLPWAGVPRRDYATRKFGSLRAAESAQRRAMAAADEAGLELRPDLAERQPSTRLAHAMLLGAGRWAPAMARMMFEAFFRDGGDLGDARVLDTIGRRFGLDLPGARAVLPQVAGYHDVACTAGIDGVPLVIVGEDHVIAGSQPIGALRALLALERYRLGLGAGG